MRDVVDGILDSWRGVDTAEAAVLAGTEAHRSLLKAVPSETARAAADVLRDVLLALGDRP